jgi:hydroxyacylglutathione hydrolase
MLRLVLPLVTCGLLAVAWMSSPDLEVDLQTAGARIKALNRVAPELSGTWPDEWIHGADCDNDPVVQVHRYNDDTFILRQSKCETYEAPFMYLLFGDEWVLLMDTGANPNTPLEPIVGGVIQQWLADNGRADINVLVAHTHGHFDHVQADPQFEAAPYVQRVVSANFVEAMAFWKFNDYPNDQPTIDLGGRVVDVLGTPGHHGASVTLYDRKTQILFTGDIVYPGHLFIFAASQVPVFIESIQRLVDFAANHPVKWVVGCHVESADTPFSPYGYTTEFQPDEAPLQFHPSILVDVLAAALSQPAPACEIFERIVIHPVYLCGILWNG